MTAVELAASRLREAAAIRVPCQPVRDLLTSGDLTEAYAVQRLNTDLAVAGGERIVGWKVGLTNPAVQRQLGVEQPDFGVLFASTGYGDDELVPLHQLLQPRVEAEVAFVLADDLPERPITHVDVLRATDFLLPAIEIVDSRVAGWDITIVDTVADNASSGLFTLGLQPIPPSAIDLRAAPMQMTHDGTNVASGSGAGCLGHPVNAVVWLANTLAGLGQPLRAGDVILSGALGPMVPVAAGTYEAVVGGLGSVRVRFEAVPS